MNYINNRRDGIAPVAYGEGNIRELPPNIDPPHQIEEIGQQNDEHQPEMAQNIELAGFEEVLLGENGANAAEADEVTPKLEVALINDSDNRRLDELFDEQDPLSNTNTDQMQNLSGVPNLASARNIANGSDAANSWNIGTGSVSTGYNTWFNANDNGNYGPIHQSVVSLQPLMVIIQWSMD